MKNIMITLLLALASASVFAASSNVKYESVEVDVTNVGALKRGAKHFVDYCLSCHSAHFMRYNRIAKDIGMNETELREDFIFTRDEKGVPSKVGSLMTVAMTDEYASNVFGTKVPDLSLVARAWGADKLYTYLRTFYVDESRPTGMNNMVFKDVGMPNVLWELQGLQKPVYRTEVHDGITIETLDHLEVTQAGSMNQKEFDQFTTDLVTFMVYLAEPVQAERKSLGWKVLFFLAIFFVFAYMLKKEYWKDVH